MLRFLVPVLLSAAAYIFLPKYIKTLWYQHLVSTIFVENRLFTMLLMSFRSGNHLLVVLQLSTHTLLPQQLELLGDVKWGNFWLVFINLVFGPQRIFVVEASTILHETFQDNRNPATWSKIFMIQDNYLCFTLLKSNFLSCLKIFVPICTVHIQKFLETCLWIHAL